MDEAKRWLDTSKEDLEVSEILLNNQKYSHACFSAQQSVEKSLKALHFWLDGDPWGHSILKLLIELKTLNEEIFYHFEKYIDSAKILDRFYIPTRYPDSLPDLTPGQAFSKNDSELAIELAKNFYNEVRKLIEKIDNL